LTLDLEAKKGKDDAERRGAIVLRLRAIDTSKAGIIAMRNAQLDIEPVERAADLTDCEVFKAADAVGYAGPMINGLSDALEKLVSKLDVFMRIGDKIANVNGCHSSLPRLTFHLGPSVCGLRLESNNIFL